MPGQTPRLLSSLGLSPELRLLGFRRPPRSGVANFRRFSRKARARGFLPGLVPAPKPADRGHLALLVEEAVELALERHGGLPPGLTTETDLEASLADQLYRARLLEFRGLAIAVGPLAALAGASGTLDFEDSAVLRFWCDVPNRQAVRLVFDTENALVGVYGPPRPAR